ncbi:MAG: hypothetical protein LC624_03615 [Halobacteriales archaeon]|nr:hypothetical protein [Halobacteriales archaeon]
MVQATLLVSAGFAFVSGIVYSVVGQAVRQRAVGEAHRRANFMFALWWWSLAALSIINFASALSAAAGLVPSVPLLVAVSDTTLLLLCVALMGLLYYLLYLFTGRAGLLAPIVAVYLGVFLLLLWLIAASDPVGVEVARWGTRLTYADPPSSALGVALAVGLLLPQALGALAYLNLARRLEDRAQRTRVEMVSVSILLWFLSSLAGSAAGLGQNDAWQVASRCISLAASLTILAAYRPTPWMQRHWGLETLLPRRA